MQILPLEQTWALCGPCTHRSSARSLNSSMFREGAFIYAVQGTASAGRLQEWQLHQPGIHNGLDADILNARPHGQTGEFR